MTASENNSEAFWDSTISNANNLAEISIEDNPLLFDSDMEESNYKRTIKLELLENFHRQENLSTNPFSKSTFEDSRIQIGAVDPNFEDENFKVNLQSKLFKTSNFPHVNNLQKPYDLKILKVELMKLPDSQLPITKDLSKKFHSAEKRSSRHRANNKRKSKSQSKELICPKRCGKKFFFASSLKKHLHKVCGYSTRYKCPKCRYKKANRYEVVRHIKRQHDELSINPVDLWAARNSSPSLNSSDVDDDDDDDEETMEKLMKKQVIKSIQFRNADSEIKISNVSSLATMDDVKPNIDELSLVKNPFEGDAKLPCTNKCGTICKSVYSLNSHIRYECQKLRYKCPYCTSRSKYTRNILSHVKLLHNDRSEYAIDTVTKRILGTSDNIRRSERLSAAQIT